MVTVLKTPPKTVFTTLLKPVFKAGPGRVRGLPGPALIVVAGFVLAGILGPWLAPADPDLVDLGRAAQGPSAGHLLGTDHLGRDELSRLLVAARTSLTAIVLVVAGAIVIGLLVGTLAGFFGGVLDTALSRVIDVGMSVPSLIVALTFIGVAGTGYANMVLALTVAWWPSYARLVRATVRGVRGQPHIEAIRVLGAGPARVLFRHLLPAAVGPVLVYGSIDAGAVALAVASLSFLGLGVQPPTPEWGQMVIDGRPLLDDQPLLVILPGVAVTLVVIAFNLLGEAIAASGGAPAPARRGPLHRMFARRAGRLGPQGSSS